MKIKKGDRVYILSGKDKGKTGKVIKTLSSQGRVVVEDVNVVKKHRRATKQGQSGQIIEKAMPVDVSNVAIMDPDTGKPVRVGIKIENGIKKRVSKKSGKEI